MSVRDFHRDCLIVDAHTDVPIRLHEEPADLLWSVEGRHVDLPKLRRGGVDALVFALYVPGSLSIEDGFRHIGRLHRLSLAQLERGSWQSVRGVEELRRVAARGRIAVLFGLENGRPLAAPGALTACAAIGVRYVTLTHGASHEWCDSATGEELHGGLSGLGVELVRRMNAAGMITDVSHVSAAAAAQTIEVSSLPVIASHSSARQLCDHPGNLSDELVREIARTGGVVMANCHPAMVDPEACRANAERWPKMAPALAALDDLQSYDPAAYAAALEEVFGAHPLPAVRLESYVRHIVHLVEIAGEEHVGIGTDFDGIPDTIEGFEDASCFPNLTAALLDAGLGRRAVRLILGENFLRVLAESERLAAAA